MAITPRIPVAPISGIDNYTIPHPHGLNNAGFGAEPPQRSGENIEHTPILPADGAKVEEEFKSITKEGADLRYQEPSMPYTGSVKSAIWHTRRGGAYIELSGKRDEPEFINIVHTSGTHITLDPNGSIIIKSFGDTHNVTKGNMYEITNGVKTQVSKGGYVLHIKDGVLDIRSEGNLNISSGADMTISAAGKLTMNIGDAIDVAGSKIAMTSRVDTFDLVATGDMRVLSLASAHIKSEASMYLMTNSALNVKAASSITNQADGAFNIRSEGATNIQADGQINLKSGSNINADGSNVFLNSGRAGNAPNATEATNAIKAGVPAEPEKSVFTDNTVSSSPSGSGAAGIADDPGE